MKINIKALLDYKNMNRRRLLIGSGIGVVVVIIIFANLTTAGSGDTDNPGPPIAVQVAEVRRQLVEQTVTAAGKIQPVFETEISSTVSGQIMAILVEEGEEVQPGDTLVILDRLRYEAAYERSKSALRSARAGLKQVRAERDRGRQLYEKSLISLQDMEILQANDEGALSRREQAEATVDQARDDLAKTTLVAPEAGVVTKLNKEVGEMALGSTFQADVLLIISDLSMMEVVVEVDETDVVDIEVLDLVKIEVDAIQDTVFEGRVSRVAHSATIQGAGTQNQVTNFEVVVTFDIDPSARRIDPRIRPGMSATSTIIIARLEDAIAVPIQAIAARQPKRDNEGGDESGGPGGRRGMARGERASGGPGGNRSAAQGGRPAGGGNRGSFQGRSGGPPGAGRPEPVEVVFVVTSDSSQSATGFLKRLFGAKPEEYVEQREVKLGISSDTHYEISTGLRAGEEIIIGNYRAVSRDLQDGRRIERSERSFDRFQGRGDR